jgi:hypothetical protein
MKPVGLCNQCEDQLYPGERLDKGYRDFRSALSRAVTCFRCGDIQVASSGLCVTDCKFHHNPPVQLTAWQRFKKYL